MRAASLLAADSIDTLAAVSVAAVERGLPVSSDQRSILASSMALEAASSHDLLWLCGALFHELHRTGALAHEVVAAPVYEHEVTSVYRSVVVTAFDGPETLDDALAGTVALNEHASWSGHHALRRHLGTTWFTGEILTGSHAASIEAVTSEQATCAAIDSSVWRAGPDRRGDLRVLAVTDDRPAPPVVLHPTVDPETRAALLDVLCHAGPFGRVQRFEPSTTERYGVFD